MKISTVFIVSFIALTSASDSYQQCGMEHAKINQLEMQIQQLKNNNQVFYDVIISSKTKCNIVNNKEKTCPLGTLCLLLNALIAFVYNLKISLSFLYISGTCCIRGYVCCQHAGWISFRICWFS